MRLNNWKGSLYNSTCVPVCPWSVRKWRPLVVQLTAYMYVLPIPSVRLWTATDNVATVWRCHVKCGGSGLHIAAGPRQLILKYTGRNYYEVGVVRTIHLVGGCRLSKLSTRLHAYTVVWKRWQFTQGWWCCGGDRVGCSVYDLKL